MDPSTAQMRTQVCVVDFRGRMYGLKYRPKYILKNRGVIAVRHASRGRVTNQVACACACARVRHHVFACMCMYACVHTCHMALVPSYDDGTHKSGSSINLGFGNNE